MIEALLGVMVGGLICWWILDSVYRADMEKLRVEAGVARVAEANARRAEDAAIKEVKRLTEQQRDRPDAWYKGCHPYDS